MIGDQIRGEHLQDYIESGSLGEGAPAATKYNPRVMQRLQETGQLEFATPNKKAHRRTDGLIP